MATTTPNYGWPVPTSTDLVKNGATAIEGLGDAIDASLAELKGGTTGQVLSKTSNTDMDFTWVAPTTGDITGVTAGTGISGGGTSGDVTVTNSMATAIDAKGDLIAGTGADAFSRLAVGTNGQVLTADSSASTGLAWATASSGMTNPMTTTGDMIYSSPGSTPVRRAIGSTGDVLTVSGGVPTWAAPSSGGGLTLINTGGTTMSGASVTVSSIPSTYKNLLIVLSNYYHSANNSHTYIRFNSDSATNYMYSSMFLNNTSYTAFSEIGSNSAYINNVSISANTSGSKSNSEIMVYRYTDTTNNKFYQYQSAGANGSAAGCSTVGSGNYKGTSAISSVTVLCDDTLSGGTIYVYGVN